MGSLQPGEIMSLHDTRESLSDTVGRHIHILARHEMRRAQFGTDGQDGVTRHAKLFDNLFRMDARTLEVAEHLTGDVSRGMGTGVGAA